MQLKDKKFENLWWAPKPKDFIKSLILLNYGCYAGRLQSSCLENPMGRGAWPATVHGVTKSRAGFSD